MRISSSFRGDRIDDGLWHPCYGGLRSCAPTPYRRPLRFVDGLRAAYRIVHARSASPIVLGDQFTGCTRFLVRSSRGDQLSRYILGNGGDLRLYLW